MYLPEVRENHCLWREKELKCIDPKIFYLIRITDRYCEFQSKSTKHYWILLKQPFNVENAPICIYHKHLKHLFYHRHWKAYNMKQAIESIKGHDKYVMEQELFGKIQGNKI